MDRQTFSNYGAIVIVVVVIAILMAFATPFATQIKDDVLGVMNNFNDKADAAVSGSGVEESNPTSVDVTFITNDNTLYFWYDRGSDGTPNAIFLDSADEQTYTVPYGAKIMFTTLLDGETFEPIGPIPTVVASDFVVTTETATYSSITPTTSGTISFE